MRDIRLIVTISVTDEQGESPEDTANRVADEILELLKNAEFSASILPTAVIDNGCDPVDLGNE